MPNLRCCAKNFSSYDARASEHNYRVAPECDCTQQSAAPISWERAGAAARRDLGASGVAHVVYLLASHQRAVLASSPFAPRDFVLTGLPPGDELWVMARVGGEGAERNSPLVLVCCRCAVVCGSACVGEIWTSPLIGLGELTALVSVTTGTAASGPISVVATFVSGAAFAPSAASTSTSASADADADAGSGGLDAGARSPMLTELPSSTIQDSGRRFGFITGIAYA